MARKLLKPVEDKPVRLNDIQRKQLAASLNGITPLEFAASVLRDETAPLSERRWACETLMPYMHQKLPTAMNVTTTNTLASFDATALEKMSDQELRSFMDTINRVIGNAR